MVSYRVLITGSRAWSGERQIEEAFDRVAAANTEGFPVVLIHGGAAGADRMCADSAKARGWRIEQHLAKWDTHDDECPFWHWELPICKMAGHRRNQEMVDSRADVCFAFIHERSRGATTCAARAKAANIPLFVWRTD